MELWMVHLGGVALVHYGIEKVDMAWDLKCRF